MKTVFISISLQAKHWRIDNKCETLPLYITFGDVTFTLVGKEHLNCVTKQYIFYFMISPNKGLCDQIWNISTCSLLAWNAVWHSTQLRAKYPNLLLLCPTTWKTTSCIDTFFPLPSVRLQAVDSSPWGAHWGRCGAASDQSELELCVTCKGEAPECDNSWVLKWSFSAWGERNRRQRECCRLWKESTPFVGSLKTETWYPLVFSFKAVGYSVMSSKQSN